MARFAAMTDVVQPRVEIGAPECSTAAGNLSGDGHAVDIVWLRPRAERERRSDARIVYVLQ